VRAESSVSAEFYRGKLQGKHYFKVGEFSRHYLMLDELKSLLNCLVFAKLLNVKRYHFLVHVGTRGELSYLAPLGSENISAP